MYGCPRDPRGLGARLFPCLVLLGRLLAAEQLGEIRLLRVGRAASQVDARGHREHVHDFALGRTDARRRDQDHLAELSRVGGRHLGRDPAAERMSDHVDRPQLLLAHIALVEAGQVADAHDPVGHRGLPEARMNRRDQRAFLGQRRIPRRPSRPSQFAMQNQQRFALAALDDRPVPCPRRGPSLRSIPCLPLRLSPGCIRGVLRDRRCPSNRSARASPALVQCPPVCHRISSRIS